MLSLKRSAGHLLTVVSILSGLTTVVYAIILSDWVGAGVFGFAAVGFWMGAEELKMGK